MKQFFYGMVAVFLVLVVVFGVFEGALRIKDLFDENRGLKNSMGDINRKYCHAFRPSARFRLISPMEISK